jgi:hypothetical protein
MIIKADVFILTKTTLDRLRYHLFREWWGRIKKRIDASMVRG